MSPKSGPAPKSRGKREAAPRLPLGEPPLRPSFRRERAAMKRGVFPVAGCDEAGRGPLAGPVVAAAVILDPKRIPRGLNDSKKLTAPEREKLYARICATAEVGDRLRLARAHRSRQHPPGLAVGAGARRRRAAGAARGSSSSTAATASTSAATARR